MYIIGTAGHVDHGKTLLIKSLTGIDTDRLPEEKKRGLTIDLGFAHFRDSRGTDIGIVDVPGHERFIRNMTSGAWGIDLALLVIAADDGWMYQTGNHLRVLQAMGITSLIAVITKIDMVSDKQLQDTIDDVQLRLLEATGAEHPLIAVSSLKGDNIDELKQLISDNLPKRDGSSESGAPLMHIDRAFGIQGAGLVVTGSLREGAVKKNDNLLLLPNNITVRVRGIQSYDTDTDSAVPACRAALNISGVDASEVKRGCCLTVENSGFTAEKEVIIELDKGIESIRNHSEAEFAAGTAHTIGSIHLLKSPPDRPLRARLNLNEALPLRSGQSVVIIRKGGSLITGSGKVIWKGKTDRDKRISIASAEKSDYKSINLAVRGWVYYDGQWIFDNDKQALFETDIKALSSSVGGIKREELAGKTNLPQKALEQLISGMISSGKLKEKSGLLFSGEMKEAVLSKAAEAILKEMKKAGAEGLDLNKNRIPGAQKELRTLTRAGLVVPLTESLFITEETFLELCAIILKGLTSGDSFDISLAKDRTGLSRKYIIPLLNKMEENKIVVREENLRRVL